LKAKCNFSSGLEYIVRNSYLNNHYSKPSYFSKNIDDNYEFKSTEPIIFETQYKKKYANGSFELAEIA